MSTKTGSVSNAPPRRRSGSFNPGSIKDLIQKFSGPSAISQVPPTPENWVIGHHERMERERAMLREASIGRRKYRLSVTALSFAVPRRLREIAQRDKSMWRESKEFASRYSSQLLWSPSQESKRNAKASNPLFGIVESVEPRVELYSSSNSSSNDSDSSSESSSSSSSSSDDDSSSDSESSSTTSDSESSSDSGSSSSDSESSSGSGSSSSSSSESDSEYSSSSSSSDSLSSSSDTEDTANRISITIAQKIKPKTSTPNVGNNDEQSSSDNSSSESESSSSESDDSASGSSGDSFSDSIQNISVQKLPGMQRYRKSLMLADSENVVEPDSDVVVGKHVLALGMRQASMVLRDVDGEEDESFGHAVDAALAKLDSDSDSYDSEVESDKESDGELESVDEASEPPEAMTRWRKSMHMYSENELDVDQQVVASKRILSMGMRQGSAILDEETAGSSDDDVVSTGEGPCLNVDQEANLSENNQVPSPTSSKAVGEGEGPAVRRWKKPWKSVTKSRSSQLRKLNQRRGDTARRSSLPLETAGTLDEPDPVVVEGKRILSIGLKKANFDEERASPMEQMGLTDKQRPTEQETTIGERGLSQPHDPENSAVSGAKLEPLVLTSEPANKDEHLRQWMKEIETPPNNDLASKQNDGSESDSEHSESSMESTGESQSETDYDEISESEDSLLNEALSQVEQIPTPLEVSPEPLKASANLPTTSPANNPQQSAAAGGVFRSSFGSLSSRGSRSSITTPRTGRCRVFSKLKSLPSNVSPEPELARESLDASLEDQLEGFTDEEYGDVNRGSSTAHVLPPGSSSAAKGSFASMREVETSSSQDEDDMPDIRDIMEMELVIQHRQEQSRKISNFNKFYGSGTGNEHFSDSSSESGSGEDTSSEASENESLETSSSTGSEPEMDYVDEDLLQKLDNSSRALGVLRASYCAIDDDSMAEVSPEVIRGKGEISVGFKLAKLDSLTEEEIDEIRDS